MKMKKIDINALLKAIIFGFFGVAILYMAYSGSLAFVLHPKMFKFTYFAAVIFLMISIFMLSKVKKGGSKKVDFKILVFAMPILFMFSNIQPLKGEALKNMSYDVLNNSNRIAKANLNNAKEQNQKSKQSGDERNNETSAAQSADMASSANTDAQKQENSSAEASVSHSEKAQNLETNKQNSPDVKLNGADNKEAQEEKNKSNQVTENKQGSGSDNKSGSSAENKNGNSADNKSGNTNEADKPQGHAVPQDHNVVNNSSIVIDTNISSGDEPLYLPSVSETKGKNYDIEKFLDDMLEAYSFTGDGSNKFDHQELEIVGFVYRDDYFESNRFMVGRILLTCCISDAQQIGVLVEGKEDYTKKFQDDSWVKVKGKLFWQELHNPYTKEDIKVLTLKPSKIEQIEDIAYPYVYFE